MKFNKHFSILSLVVVALIMRFGLERGLEEGLTAAIRLGAVVGIIVLGMGYVLRGAAGVIEETTETLSKRTNIAGGLLQSLGTAFPDMVLGVVAALVSSSLRHTDYAAAVSYAVIAAATTFGSNIYNVGHAAWCVWRQNLADRLGAPVPMWPILKTGGRVRPLKSHERKPTRLELENATQVLMALSLITAAVAIAMVIFGLVASPPDEINGDLYQLLQPLGIVLFVICAGIMYYFRGIKRSDSPATVIDEEDKYYNRQSNSTIWLHLLGSGIAILFAAETMVKAVRVFCEVTGMPLVIAGVLAGVVGCLGEMMVIHNYTVHPKGRIGDALVGVAMDNIVTTMGAAIVAIMGGIFLGGSALIVIFVLILAINTVLIYQVNKLKDGLITVGAKK